MVTISFWYAFKSYKILLSSFISLWVPFLALILRMKKKPTFYISLMVLFLFNFKKVVVWLNFGVGPLLSLARSWVNPSTFWAPWGSAIRYEFPIAEKQDPKLPGIFKSPTNFLRLAGQLFGIPQSQRTAIFHPISLNCPPKVFFSRIFPPPGCFLIFHPFASPFTINTATALETLTTNLDSSCLPETLKCLNIVTMSQIVSKSNFCLVGLHFKLSWHRMSIACLPKWHWSEARQL